MQVKRLPHMSSLAIRNRGDAGAGRDSRAGAPINADFELQEFDLPGQFLSMSCQTRPLKNKTNINASYYPHFGNYARPRNRGIIEENTA